MLTLLPAAPDLGDQRRQLLLRLVALRSIMLLVAVFSIWFFANVLERSLATPVLLGIVCAGVALTAFSLFRLRLPHTLRSMEMQAHIYADAVLLVALVFFAGGATNPFIYYALVLIAIYAAVYPGRRAWVFCISCAMAYSALMYADLSGHAHHGFSDFQIHLLGMWFNFVGSALLLCFFVSHFARALTEREASLAEAQREVLRQEHLVGIATMAASTAHHLGTPLSSMGIVLDELNSEDPEEVREAIELLQSQLQRCKTALNTLSRERTDPGRVSVASELLSALKEHYHLTQPSILPTWVLDDSAADTRINAELLLQHALINLVDNAIRAARQHVTCTFRSTASGIDIEIENDGSPIPEAVLENWGKPLSGKHREGLGLGIFLAHYSIEKAGGKLEATNLSTHGSRVVIRLPEIR